MRCALVPATLLAQQGATRFQGATLEESSKKLGLGAPKSNLSELGYTIAPGIVFAPTVNMETGYSSNPDELFANAEGSLYGLTNGTASDRLPQQHGRDHAHLSRHAFAI